ncbi:hypothetical protein IC229_05915 [Spirosoma sp. BT702]|uniref:Uncharacterized protein n=1 Tax=Spirosoma profusum TaxID=2771354 RepID=A0A926XU26_9BACT|nr:hypothetical protein [Spirosoma profusum]MBD2700162.1 hypothetical protein [Spirosoma profusum]
METTKIYLDVPNDIHLLIKEMQIEKQRNGEKVNLRELYIQLLKQAVAK